MLNDLQTYIATHNTVSLQDLSHRFHIDRDALAPMLQRLSRKGRIRRLPMPEKCTGCTCCDLTSLERYEWLGKSC
ncbi:MAG: FeoC-like transcriptional regulator [Leptolyngbyaceae cyanobacterium]